MKAAADRQHLGQTLITRGHRALDNLSNCLRAAPMIQIPHQLTALVADDNGASRAELVSLLERQWPELRVVAQAANGADAWDLFLERAPDICFLDMRMPGLTGIEIAQRIGPGARVVVMASDNDPALKSLGSVGARHLRKPFELHQTVSVISQLQDLSAPHVPGASAPALVRRSNQVRRHAPLETIPGLPGSERRDVTVDEIVYLEAEGRFTRVVQLGGETRARYALKEIVPQLDPEEFWQIHRFIVVNRRHIDSTIELEDGGICLTLKGRSERLEVGSHFIERFRKAAA